MFSELTKPIVPAPNDAEVCANEFFIDLLKHMVKSPSDLRDMPPHLRSLLDPNNLAASIEKKEREAEHIRKDKRHMTMRARNACFRMLNKIYPGMYPVSFRPGYYEGDVASDVAVDAIKAVMNSTASFDQLSLTYLASQAKLSSEPKSFDMVQTLVLITQLEAESPWGRVKMPDGTPEEPSERNIEMLVFALVLAGLWSNPELCEEFTMKYGDIDYLEEMFYTATTDLRVIDPELRAYFITVDGVVLRDGTFISR